MLTDLIIQQIRTIKFLYRKQIKSVLLQLRQVGNWGRGEGGVLLVSFGRFLFGFVGGFFCCFFF